jgi:F-type H+-transporting ATPase subunit alpha
MSEIDQVVVIYAATKGYLDDVPIARVREFETGLIAEVRDKHKPIVDALTGTKELSNDSAKALDGAITEFKRRFMGK